MTVVPVLAYHTFSGAAPRSVLRPFAHPLHIFRKHLDHVEALGYEVVLARDIVALADTCAATSRPKLCMTIDDGYTDFIELAAPELSARGMVATVFVPAGNVGGRADWLAGEDRERPLMNAAHLRDLVAAGFEVGAHSMTHAPLDRACSTTLRDETATAKASLEDAIGGAVQTFAYPFGYHSNAARTAVREAGYLAAFGLTERVVDLRRDSPFALPRTLAPTGASRERMEECLKNRRSLHGDLWTGARQTAHGLYRRATCRLGSTERRR